MFDSIIPYISGAIGIAMGLLYAFSGFRDNQKSDVLQNNPRVKNFLWIVGGAVTVVFADWKILSQDEISTALRGKATLSYVACATVTMVVFLSAIAVGIYFNAKSRGSNNESMKRSAFQLLMIFLHHGYAKYLEKYSELDRNSTPEEIHNRENLAQYGKAVATSIAVCMRDSAAGISREHRLGTIDNLLDAIENTVLLMSGGSRDLAIKTNYMVRVARQDLQRERAPAPLFQFGDAARYERFLVLRRYKGSRGAQVCLPVEPKGGNEPILPGAPEAFSSGEYRIINSKSVNIEKGFPKNIKDDLSKYFKNAPYKSVMSLPISKGRKIIGILNIESNKVDILDQSDDMVDRIARAIQPYCLLLGEVVSSYEEEAKI